MYTLSFNISYPLQRITDYLNNAVQHAFTNALQVLQEQSEPAQIQIPHSKPNYNKFTLSVPESIEKHSMQQRKDLLVLDFDDTIFPTYFVKTQLKKGALHTPAFKKQMNELVVCLKDTFEEMIRTYESKNIIIVTNGTYSWIYDQCTVFPAFKNFIEFLQVNNISIISAACDYSYYDSECRSKWKEFAFTDIFSKTFDNDNNITKSVTSIGDSFDEWSASKMASENIKNCILHRIKFKSKPSINDIIMQMQNIKSIVHKFRISTENMEIIY